LAIGLLNDHYEMTSAAVLRAIETRELGVVRGRAGK
jgi:hypothetical protein